MIPNNFSIDLTSAERDAILKHVSLSSSIAARLRFAIHTRTGLEFALSGDDIIDFGEALDKHLRHIKNQKDARLVEGVLSRFALQLNETMLADRPESEPDDFDFPPDMPQYVRDALRQVMETHEFTSPEELMLALQDTLVNTDITPRDYLLGLNAGQVLRLMQCDWTASSGPLQLNGGLSRETLAGSIFCTDALQLLALLDQTGGLKLTGKMNLNRAAVKRLLDDGCCPDFDREDLARFYKVVNETDVMPLHVLHILLTDTKLARHYKGKLVLTKAGANILKDGAAGRLQCLLFEGLFQGMNLAYLDRMPDYPGIQSTIAFILYAIHRVAQEPITVEHVVDTVLMPIVREEILHHAYANHARSVIITRVIHPLVRFGLIHLTQSGERFSRNPDHDLVQVTPLFNEFLRFNPKEE